MTDKIRDAFELAVSKTTFLGADGLQRHESDLIKVLKGQYKYKMAADLYEFFQAAYAQGQRDLVAGMEPVMYQSSNQDGYYRFYEACKTPPSFLDEERYLGYTVRALAFVPELEK